MPIPVSCKGCQSKLRVPDEHAGKKVRCPKCQATLLVPFDEPEVVAEVDDRIADAPVDKTRKKALPPRDEPREAVREGRGKSREGEEEDEDRPRRGGKRGGKNAGKWVPCPRCGASGATRVLWTAWGSFYGPAMFSHVRCPECDCRYNGKSGGSNMVPAIVFVTVPLIGILAILGGLGYFLYMRLVLKQ